jgi:hypothetical protein
MKWKGGNKRVSKIYVNPAEYPRERLHVDASGSLLLPQGRQEYWSKIKMHIAVFHEIISWQINHPQWLY